MDATKIPIDAFQTSLLKIEAKGGARLNSASSMLICWTVLGLKAIISTFPNRL